ncbi:MAG: S9 family peptidase [Candidatus Eiseniibacteriota bacterium]|jgi:dipeptidyl aminopeptidase/acylaminoacyl peptidase
MRSTKEPPRRAGRNGSRRSVTSTDRAGGIPRLPARRFFATRPIHGCALSPDGERVAFITTISGSPEVWIVPARGGWPDQLTFDRRVSPLSGLRFSPDGRWIAYMADRDGDEAFDVLAVPTAGGEPVTVHAVEGRRAYLGDWHESGLLLSVNDDDPARFGVVRRRASAAALGRGSGGRLEVLHAARHDIDTFVHLSRDGRWLLIARFHHNTWQELLLRDLERGTVATLTPPEEGDGGAISDGRVLDDGTVLVLCTHGVDRRAIAHIDPRNGAAAWRWLVRRPHEIQALDLSRDERVLLWIENRDGADVMRVRHRPTGAERDLPVTPGAAAVMELSRDKQRVLFLQSTPRSPAEIRIYDTGSSETTQISRSMLGGLRSEYLVEPERVRLAAGDGVPLTALFYPPTTGDTTPPWRTVVWCHGGPESQDRLEYNAWIQFLANQGFGVLTVNFRGSTGSGKAFQRMIYRDWGGASYLDVLAGIRHLEARGTIDPARLALMGGSFGGYMTLWGATQDPKRWRAAVDIFGPSNLVTFVESVPEFWKPGVHRLVGDPASDLELLRERSPLTDVDRIRAPLFVVQGANDPRVVADESRRMVEAIRARGGEVEYLELPDEGHGFSKLENKIEVMERSAAFLDRHLRR